MAHAAGESSPGELPHGTHVVVLQAGPIELAEVAHRLARAGIPHAPIIESDPPFEHQLVALGISPLVERRVIRKLTGCLPLLGREEVHLKSA